VIFDLRLRRPAQRPSSLAGQDIGKIVKYLPLVPLPIRLCARIVADLLRLFTSAFCPDVFSIGIRSERKHCGRLGGFKDWDSTSIS
jgi:hypothetical protein